LTLAHHELCFGCGNANLFGLQMELEPADGQPGAVTGRFFLKQDHQGRPGEAHDGVMASALQEAMSMALHSKGLHARTTRMEVSLVEPAPLGVFVRLDARVEGSGDGELTASAVARSVGDDAHELAQARATFEPV